MQAQYETVMKDAISRVLETMFYTSVDFADDLPPSVGVATPFYGYESSIAIVGPLGQHEIAIRSTTTFGRTITANFLGISEEDTKVSEMADTMNELINMVAGEVLAKGFGDTYRLGLPRFLELTGNQQAVQSKAVSLQIYYDEEPQALALVS